MAKRIMGLIAAAVLFGALSAAPAVAGEPRPEAFLLDEYILTVARTSSSFQLAAGLDFGNSFGRGYWWFGGGRLSWVQGESRGDLTNAWTLGAAGGLGFRPDRTISPIARLGFDRWFGGDGTYRSQASLSVGARFRVSSRVDQHYAVSFEAYRSMLSGAAGVPDEEEFGILVGYSVAFHRKR